MILPQATQLDILDAFGSLRSVKLPNDTSIEYLVDGSGRRVGKKVNGVVTQKWLYSSDLRIIAELDSANKVKSRFVYTSSANVPEYMIKDSTIYKIITDYLGSVKQVVNTQTGAIVQQTSYDEWGNVIRNYDSLSLPFGFAGGLYDSQTKLVRFGARDYDAQIGRWTIKDPIRFGGNDENLYSYIGQDPINSVDVRGLWAKDQHEELTIKAMEGQGFTEKEIKWAVAANRGQDECLFSNFDDAAQGSAKKSLCASFYMAQLSQAIIGDMIADITGSESDSKAAMTYLGQGLHSIQDVNAHQGAWGSWIMHGLGEAGIVTHPDDQNVRKKEYDNALIDSKSYIKLFILEIFKE